MVLEVPVRVPIWVREGALPPVPWLVLQVEQAAQGQWQVVRAQEEMRLPGHKVGRQKEVLQPDMVLGAFALEVVHTVAAQPEELVLLVHKEVPEVVAVPQE